MKTWRWYAVPVLVGLVGCASSPPSTFYTLAPIGEASARATALGDRGPRVGLGPLALPHFLDRPQIVVRDGVQLRFDEFHRWGGSLDDDFLRVWGENLAHLLGTGQVYVFPTEVKTPVDFRVVAEVLSFEGHSDGTVQLKVRWSVLDPYRDKGLLVREETYRRAVPVAAEGGVEEAALVSGLSAVLGDFSRDVADALRRLPRPRPPVEPSFS
ncbi:PqiC family protein [Thiococcus pfennigii]|uniref:PqiC family protein n=1 Tax=Thiococcus pfennigii TaxID=1057 RepID=UPI001907384F|nr:PqiC family protein [Thiococcus pfennigii]MBK1700689.1 hypothetical protein [Thiococcus pfennigii]MBK1730363.1 hypothetical protein [Thiococcus pfennigii]